MFMVEVQPQLLIESNKIVVDANILVVVYIAHRFGLKGHSLNTMTITQSLG